MTTAAIYARRSTAEQDASITAQVSECEAFAEGQGWEVGATYSDTASGWKEDTPRPEFDRMLRAAAGREFDVLVVWEVSRLSRQEDDRSALAIIWDLRGMGVEVHSVIDPRTGVKLADDMNLLIKSHLAKEESDTKSKRVKRGKRRGALNGVYQGANAPYGYRKLDDKKPHKGRLINFYEPDPHDSVILREIVSAYVDGGRSPQEIADWLNERGIDPPRAGANHRYKRRKEPTWHQSTLRNLLDNALIAGFATYKGKRIKDCGCAELADIAAGKARRKEAVAAWESCEHEWVRSVNIPPILSDEEWTEVRRTIEDRQRPHVGGRGNHDSTDKFLLAGLVWCGNCRERIGCRADRRSGNRDRDYYRCRGRRVADCELPHIPQSELDEAVREHFVERFVDSIDTQASIEKFREALITERESRAAVIQEEISEVEEELRATQEFRERVNDDYSRGAITPEQWSRLDGECGERVDRATTALDNLRVALEECEQSVSTAEVDALLDALNSVKRIVEGRLASADVPRLNAELHRVFEEFRISSKGERIIVEPKLRQEFLPEGDWKRLDFADEDAEGIEVVDYIEPVLRKVDLLPGNLDANATYSS